MFADFYDYWRALWWTMGDEELKACYLKSVSVFAGFMSDAESRRIISGYEAHTFLVRFSVRNPSALTLVVSKGIGLKPSKRRIYVRPEASDSRKLRKARGM